MGFDDDQYPLDEGDATGTEAGDTITYGEDRDKDDLWHHTLQVCKSCTLVQHSMALGNDTVEIGMKKFTPGRRDLFSCRQQAAGSSQGF